MKMHWVIILIIVIALTAIVTGDEKTTTDPEIQKLLSRHEVAIKKVKLAQIQEIQKLKIQLIRDLNTRKGQANRANNAAAVHHANRALAAQQEQLAALTKQRKKAANEKSPQRQNGGLVLQIRLSTGSYHNLRQQYQCTLAAGTVIQVLGWTGSWTTCAGNLHGADGKIDPKHGKVGELWFQVGDQKWLPADKKPVTIKKTGQLKAGATDKTLNVGDNSGYLFVKVRITTP